jgi:flavin reductase
VTTPPPTPDEFRHAVGRFATGVTVVASCHGDILHGMTANAFASVSLDPLLVLVCVDRSAGMHDLLPAAGTFAVSVLAADQQGESIWFASPRRPAGTDQFDDVAWSRAPVTGCPVLEGSVAWLDCRLVASHEAGDHTIYVGEVLAVGHDPDREPLLYYASSYRSVAPEADLPEP